MENLARKNYDKDADLLVRQELQSARIPVVNVGSVLSEEVKTRYIGVLNGFTFRRKDVYWIVSGYMPFEDAMFIYDKHSEFGIRAGGRPMNVSPEWVWDSKCPAFKNKVMELLENCSCMQEFVEKTAKEVHENEDDFKYVTLYHVDSLLGLCKLAETIISRNIHSSDM